MNESITRSVRIEAVAVGVFIAFLALSLSLVYWAAVRAPVLAQRDDNPRVVEAELQIRRGRILDANGIVLAETVGSENEPVRRYPVSPSGPAVGYYSFRHGTAGVEAGLDEVLRGENDDTWEAFWRRTLHQSQVGRDVRLTLDADWQRRAEAQMADQTGALVVLSIPDGAVKIMVSSPGYDPNRIDDLFDQLVNNAQAPLLNRVTQGLYQPGLSLQPFVLAYALDRDLMRLQELPPGASERVPVNGQLIACRQPPGDEATWESVLQQVCPYPMVALADVLGPTGMVDLFERFALFSQPDLPLATAQNVPKTIDDVEDAVLGQDSLTVSPLQMARAWVALANHGQLAAPYVVREAQDGAGVWQTFGSTEASVQAIEAAAADAILGALPTHDGIISEHAAVALSGPQEATTAWYMGLTPVVEPRYAVVVVLEGAADSASAQEIGRIVLRSGPVLE